MKMLKSLLLLPIKGDIGRSGPRFGPARSIETTIEGAGFGLDGGTVL